MSLTEDDKFAVCVMAGIPFTWEATLDADNYVVTLRTLCPCAVTVTPDGNFAVFSLPVPGLTDPPAPVTLVKMQDRVRTIVPI